jgi:hypothetical protein
MEKPRTMRQHWFDHVRRTRVKLTKKTKENVSHREAMKIASDSWPAEKQKIERANKRAVNKKAKEKKTVKV